MQFGSSAGLAAVIGRAKGVPIKAVYVFSRPEWTALVVRRDSPIRTVAELKGKSIAATIGTDPHLFLLRSLHQAGIKGSDVKIIALQHAQGREAMEHDRVDAWAGMDPLMADSELGAGSRLIYRNIAFNSYGFLNVTEDFAQQYPDAVKTVIAAYERARKWIIANPDEAARILADEANISLEVARLQLIRRTDFSQSTIGQEHFDALRLAFHVLAEEGVVSNRINAQEVISALIDPTFVKAVVRRADRQD